MVYCLLNYCVLYSSILIKIAFIINRHLVVCDITFFTERQIHTHQDEFPTNRYRKTFLPSPYHLSNQLTSHFFGHQNSPTRANLRNLPPLPHPPLSTWKSARTQCKSKQKKNGARKSKTFPIHYYLLGLI